MDDEKQIPETQASRDGEGGQPPRTRIGSGEIDDSDFDLPSGALIVGSPVRITGGSYAGLLGVVEHPRTRTGRVGVTICVMGRDTPVELDPRLLEVP